MTKRVLIFFLAFVVLLAFSLPVLAQNEVEGKVQALNKAAKKITINGTEYTLSDKAAKVDVKVGDTVHATIDINGKVVTNLYVLT